jgi:hypothetical protein
VETEASAIGQLCHCQVLGNAECSGPLEPTSDDATGTVELGPFEFSAPFTWQG